MSAIWNQCLRKRSMEREAQQMIWMKYDRWKWVMRHVTDMQFVVCNQSQLSVAMSVFQKKERGIVQIKTLFDIYYLSYHFGKEHQHGGLVIHVFQYPLLVVSLRQFKSSMISKLDDSVIYSKQLLIPVAAHYESIIRESIQGLVHFYNLCLCYILENKSSIKQIL